MFQFINKSRTDLSILLILQRIDNEIQLDLQNLPSLSENNEINILNIEMKLFIDDLILIFIQ